MDAIEADIERILKRFSEELSGVEVSDALFLEREHAVRKPVHHAPPDGFRERVFANAPSSDGERIFAEKRSW